MMEEIYDIKPNILKEQQNLCIFCCKPLTSTFQTILEFQHFFTSFSRQTGLNLRELNIDKWLPDLKCCCDCGSILKNYCNLYHEIQCMELKLHWQIDKLWNIMKLADRIPSRVKTFKDWCTSQFSQLDEIDKTKSKLNLDNNSLVQFRGKLRKLCKQNRCKKFPRVLIKKLTFTNNETGISPKLNVSADSLSSDTTVFSKDDVVLNTTQSDTQKCRSEDSSFESDTEIEVENSWSPERPNSSAESSEDELSVSEASKTRCCSKCKPPKWFRSNMSLKWHQRYLHSNGRIQLSSDRMRGLSIEKCNLLNFPSSTKQHHCTNNDCNKVLNTSMELENHTKYYHSDGGACHFCNSVQSSAMQLIEHEWEHAEFKQHQFYCGRCSTGTLHKMDFVDHYLECHLKLPLIQAICPICQKTFKNKEKVPINHYVNCHDLNRLDDPSNPFRCNVTDCLAYFLTEEQLHIHNTKQHQSNVGRSESRIRASQMWKLNNTNTKSVCSQCPKSFFSKNALQRHVWRVHSGRKKGKPSQFCIDNTVISLPEDDITIDDLVFDRKARYFCQVDSCKKGFIKESDLHEHSKLHGDFKCQFCSMTKSFASDLAEHELIHKPDWHKGDSNLSCARCEFTTAFRQSYIIHHVETHLNLKMDKIQCPICSYVFTRKPDARKQEIKTSILNHYLDCHDFSGDKANSSKYECTWQSCPAYFRTHLQLQHHLMKVHEKLGKVDRNKCTDCNKCFKSGLKLQRHRISKHNLKLSECQFICSVPQCSKRFERAVDLEYHLKLVHPCKTGDTKSLQCPKNCGRSFWNLTALKSHLKFGKEHRSENPSFVCHTCGRILASKSGLLTHLQAHKTSKTEFYICDQCGKGFKTREKLNQHKQFHQPKETWKFTCPVCSKKIITQQKLDEHLRTHTKEKPFICEICSQAYAHRHNWRQHMAKKHPVNKFEQT